MDRLVKGPSQPSLGGNEYAHFSPPRHASSLCALKGRREHNLALFPIAVMSCKTTEASASQPPNVCLAAPQAGPGKSAGLAPHPGIHLG
jgi:hypothetical protein